MARLKGSADHPTSVALSVVVPFFNEEDNVQSLYEEIARSMQQVGQPYEIIFIDDGSHDRTLTRLKEMSAADEKVVVIPLIRNFGQTAAVMAGFDAANGNIILVMDGDGQNDPADIPRLLETLDAGYDVVSGWRMDRKDKTLTRKIPSAIANRLISFISGVRLHDYGCSLKAYRRDVIKGARLYGEMHRFIPIYAAWEGAKITELPVNHRARRHGVSKYGLKRTFKVLLDLLLVLFFDRYLTRPIHAFGGISFICFGLAILTGIWALWLKIVEDVAFILTPLPLIVVMFAIAGLTALMMGIVAELVIRTYYESQEKRTYIIDETPES